MINATGTSAQTTAIAQMVASHPTSASKPTGADPANPDLKYLTNSDFELVYQATGRRIDESSDLVPMFAIQLANDRHYGDLPPQGPVSSDYLAALATRYSDAPWMVDQASRALAWVEERGGYAAIDVRA